MKNIVLTIGLPVYNDAVFLERTLNSILSQDFSNFKLIISDDCSTDNSKEICLKYKENDSRIEYIRQTKNFGISRNMQFLLLRASTEYFMWAGDDDIMQQGYLEVLINELETNKNVIAAFTPYFRINEDDNVISNKIVTDYSGISPKERINKYIQIFDDVCGYGMFRRDEIRKVKFPVWIWPNRKIAYNNIYPTICYYLAKGEFVLAGNEPLFYKRIKSKTNINHKIPLEKYFLSGWFSLFIRKLNLVFFSIWMINRAGEAWSAFKMTPKLFYHWFWKPVLSETKHRIKFVKKYKFL
jgi:glycosyltransferase involved in cell wall biosynthesis